MDYVSLVRRTGCFCNVDGVGDNILRGSEGFIDQQEIYGGHIAEGVEELITVGDGGEEGGFGELKPTLVL